MPLRLQFRGMSSKACASTLVGILWAFSIGFEATLRSDEPVAKKDAAGQDGAEKSEPKKGDLVPFNKQGTVLLDKPGKRILLKTQVALREGTLEQFCCLKQTKEHESILSLDARAKEVHAALLIVGAKPGAPVQFNPEYKPPSGQKIDIFVSWSDEQGKLHRVSAKQWIRNATLRFWTFPLTALPASLKIPKDTELRYDTKLKELSWYGPMTTRQKQDFLALSKDQQYRKAILFFFDQGQSREMEADWVFAGSAFVRDEETKQEFYLAEEGDLICVANFPSATIDVAIQSSADAGGLMFEAWTEHIPPKGTPVTIEIIPVFDKDAKKP